MKLSQLIAVDKDVEITGIETDSRRVKTGNLFLCLEGEKTDGHRFVREALEKGAVAVVTEKRLGIENEILVPDTHRAASSLYSAWYDNPQRGLTIFGVTGTNGKTSTVSMLDAIYRSAGMRTATFGTLGIMIDGTLEEGDNTTPLPALLYRKLREAKDKGVDRVFMEVSSHALAGYRTADLHFDTAIYTNLTQDHLDYHKTMAEYAKVKAGLFRQCDKGIFNYDDPYAYEASRISPCRRYGYGHKRGCDFRFSALRQADISALSYRVRYGDRSFDIVSSLIGHFQVYNSLAAMAAALLDGIEPSTIQRALRELRGVKGRLEILYNETFTLILDYAHTPDALLSVLNVLREYRRSSKRPRRLRVLFGCGGDRDRSKRPMMGNIAMRLADDVIVTSDNPRSESKSGIIHDILAGTDGHQSATTLKVIEDRREALQYAIDSAREGDILLIAGKGHEEYEIDCNGKHSFSERQILRERMQARGYLP